MTETSSQRDDLVEAITRQVLAAFASGAGAGAQGADGDPCASCLGACAARCATKVRDVVAGGASRVDYHGRAADVPADLAHYIDHTLLRPDASAADIDRLCAEAAEYRFAAVCINPTWVRPCRAQPAGHGRRGGLGHRLPVRGGDQRGQGARGAPGHPRRGPRDRHGHQHRGAQERDARRGPRGHRAGLGCLPGGRRAEQGDHRGGAPHRRGEGDRLPAREGRRRRTW